MSKDQDCETAAATPKLVLKTFVIPDPKDPTGKRKKEVAAKIQPDKPCHKEMIQVAVVLHGPEKPNQEPLMKVAVAIGSDD